MVECLNAIDALDKAYAQFRADALDKKEDEIEDAEQVVNTFIAAIVETVGCPNQYDATDLVATVTDWYILAEDHPQGAELKLKLIYAFKKYVDALNEAYGEATSEYIKDRRTIYIAELESADPETVNCLNRGPGEVIAEISAFADTQSVEDKRLPSIARAFLTRRRLRAICRRLSGLC